MQRLNISKGHAFIMVYSITSRQSLEELKPTWEIIHEIKVKEKTSKKYVALYSTVHNNVDIYIFYDFQGSLENVPLMLVGNKCDETESRELTTKDGEEQARKWSCHFMETSAKNNYNVKELFQVSYVQLHYY